MPETEGNTEPAKPNGRPIKKPTVPSDTLVAAALEPNMGRTQMRAKAGIGETAARAIMAVTSMTIEEFQEAQRIKLQAAADEALAQARAKIGDASSLQAATVYGIFSDKIHRQPNTVHQSLHLHIGGANRGDMLKALLGRHGERVSPTCDPISTREANPVIELDLAPAQSSQPAPICGAGDSQSPAIPPK